MKMLAKVLNLEERGGLLERRGMSSCEEHEDVVSGFWNTIVDWMLLVQNGC